jgi:uncharacterized membrane protein YhfC
MKFLDRYLLAILTLLVGKVSLIASAPSSYLAVACDGTSREQQVLVEQPGTWIVNRSRAVNPKRGSIIYRVPIGLAQLDRLSFEMNQVPYRLEFSADGTNWEALVSIVSIASKPMEFGMQGTGFTDAQRESAKASGYAWLRFRSASEAQSETIQLRRLRLNVRGVDVPGHFVRAAWWRESSSFATGPLMVAVAIVPVLFFWRPCRAGWRIWFGGAALWFISVALKLLIAVLANAPIQRWVKAALTPSWADLIFWSYIGLLTGIFECGILLVFARLIRRTQWTLGRALALGLGFGAFEALALGMLSSIASAWAPQSNAAFGFSTWSDALVGPFERLLTLPIHTVSVVLIVRALVKRQWRWFWASFVYKSAVDGVAAWLLLSGTNLLYHHWLMEWICFAPFALLGILGLVYLGKSWKVSPLDHVSEPFSNEQEFHASEMPKSISST